MNALDVPDRGSGVSAGPRGAAYWRLSRRFQIFVAASLFTYGLGAFFGRHPYVLTAAVLFSFAVRERWRSRQVLDAIKVYAPLPELWPAGSSPVINVALRTTRPVTNVEVSLQLPDESEAPGVLFDSITPAEPVEHPLQLAPHPRGVLEMVEIHLGCGGDMGLIRHVEVRHIDQRFYIYPAPLAPTRTVSPPLEPAAVTTGILPGPISATGQSMLRPFSTGDSMRRIHWRATARLGEIVVMSTRVGPLPRVLILVDNGNAAALERVLRVASHVLTDRDRSRKRVLALASAGPESVRLDEDDPVTLGRKRLALAQAGDPGDLRAFLARAPRFLPECEIRVVSATPPHLPSVEGYPLGFYLAGTGDRQGILEGEPQ